MSSEQNKWADAVTKLIKLTQDGELRWRTATPSESDIESKDGLQGVVYVTDYMRSTLRLYKLRTKESSHFMFGGGRVSKQSDFIWMETVKLELIDALGNTLFTFPQISGLKDLYSSVGYQTAGVDELLNNLLSA